MNGVTVPTFFSEGPINPRSFLQFCGLQKSQMTALDNPLQSAITRVWQRPLHRLGRLSMQTDEMFSMAPTLTELYTNLPHQSIVAYDACIASLFVGISTWSH